MLRRIIDNSYLFLVNVSENIDSRQKKLRVIFYECGDITLKNKIKHFINTFKYHVFALMGRFQLELIYLYFPPSFHQTVVVSVL